VRRGECRRKVQALQNEAAGVPLGSDSLKSAQALKLCGRKTSACYVLERFVDIDCILVIATFLWQVPSTIPGYDCDQCSIESNRLSERASNE